MIIRLAVPDVTNIINPVCGLSSKI